MIIEHWCELISEALDGDFGWQVEIMSILAVVVVFNFLAKWVLRKLHQRYALQKKVWKDGFVQALYTPLSTYTWIFALAHSVNLVLPQISDAAYFKNLHIFLEVTFIANVAWFLLRWKNAMIKLLRQKQGSFERGELDVIDKLVTVVVLFTAAMLVLEATGRSMNTLIAFGGVGGLAIAIASQEIIGNCFGGIMIYFTRPFNVGDWIHLPERDLEGYVEEIGWYMTRIRTFEKRPIYVPNSTFGKIVVETPSRMSHRQFEEIIGVRYSDLKTIKAVISDMNNMLKNHPDIDREQRNLAHLNAFGTYAVEIKISCYTRITDTDAYADVLQDLLFRIADILEKNKVEMAFPTTVMEIPNGIYVKGEPK